MSQETLVLILLIINLVLTAVLVFRR